MPVLRSVLCSGGRQIALNGSNLKFVEKVKQGELLEEIALLNSSEVRRLCHKSLQYKFAVVVTSLVLIRI